MRLTDINRYLDRITLTNYLLILTNYRMTKTEYVEYEIVLVNIGLTLVKHQLAGSVKHQPISVNFFYEGIICVYKSKVETQVLLTKNE